MPHPELTLERRIDAELCGLDAKMCVYADDLHGHVVERGADDEFESASTIKIYILGCLYAQAEAGKASLDAELTYEARHFVDGSGLIRSLGEGARLRARDVATLMIVVSDNIATNMLIDYLGLDTINAFIRSIGCTNTKLHRSLRSDNWSEKLGTITPRDMGRFFALLAKGELVSPQASDAMRNVFRQQHYNTMLAGSIPPYYTDPEESHADPDLIYVASKSGSMDACRNDGGLIHTPYGDYVLVMMCTDFANKLEVNGPIRVTCRASCAGLCAPVPLPARRTIRSRSATPTAWSSRAWARSMTRSPLCARAVRRRLCSTPLPPELRCSASAWAFSYFLSAATRACRRTRARLPAVTPPSRLAVPGSMGWALCAARARAWSRVA